MAEDPTTAQTESLAPTNIGSWCFGMVPAGWELIHGHGIRDANEGAFPSSVIVGEDTLRAETTLQEYIKAQLVVINTYLPGARSIELRTEESTDADEVAMLEIELPALDGGTGFLRQLYARFGDQVGVVTFTTLISALSHLEPTFESIRAELTFRRVQGESADSG